jgi:5-methyltetrahydropteroyltriglutamate--homocysteine methyltransferase
MAHSLTTHLLGFPRIGEKRELKQAAEAHWKGALSADQLRATGRELRLRHWRLQEQAGISLIPSNDFSFYDQMLDMTCLLGNVPARFSNAERIISLETYFAIARGTASACSCHPPQSASEMTKWFDTNYHYIVPEFDTKTSFRLASAKVFDEFEEALAAGIKTKPVLIGPVTYLALGKSTEAGFDRFSLLDKILPVYAGILQQLAALGAEWVQLDEPALALDLEPGIRALYTKAYTALRQAAPNLKLIAATYFGELADNRVTLLNLPVDAVHIDAVRAPHELEAVLTGFPKDKILSLGIIDGRNIWKNDLHASLALIDKARVALGGSRLWLAPSCSLLHVPVTLRHETSLDAELKNWLAFAEEKLAELVTLARHAAGDFQPLALKENQTALLSRKASTRIHRPAVKQRLAAVTEADARRLAPFPERQKAQRARLKLPLYPTTTIGSFPQTAEIRSARAKWKKGDWTGEQYEAFLEEATTRAVQFQESIGIDMLVHGEFERNDMVEYFGEQLDGFAFTQNGWVQSYGSRCVKPPVIYGDVARPRPMTVRWSAYAQSLTQKPMKGMLTGPVTILQWSFVRDDQPRRETTRQIALAIRDEVVDLEKAGIAAIQIDEPAVREGLPLRRKDWDTYLQWAVGAFRLCASGVRNDTQIHTHMCYAEFNDIIEAIAEMDADVITIETSRSNMELLGAFVGFKYPAEIGPGVYDIHSPRVPEAVEMVALMKKAGAVLPPENLWVNPDCGLKTRGWPEVTAALGNMVRAARDLRDGAASRPPERILEQTPDQLEVGSGSPK